jgi:hypothetical protein
MKDHAEIWNEFCERQNVQGTWVPLFHSLPDGTIGTKEIGTANVRRVLRRSEEMEELVRSECNKLISDLESGKKNFDGLIYIMAVLRDGDVVPLYIGKAETVGRGGGNLSANIQGIDRDTSKFARWGDNYAYHIGNLSAIVIPGHLGGRGELKYKSWAETLFKSYPSDAPVLREPVYFWTKAWSSREVGAWEEFGPTALTFLEYQLIGVASSAFGKELLNREGRNRE